MVGDELEHALARGRELLVGGPAVGRAGDLAGLDLLAQAGDADLEELVEVAREDGQELDPLEQRVALVARLVEHAGVELEPRQLAVEVGERAPSAGVARRGRAATTATAGRAGAPGSIAAIGWCSGLFGGVADVRAARRARIARLTGGPGQRQLLGEVPPLAVRRVEPDAHHAGPIVGSTKTSSVRRKRGSSGVPGGSPPAGPAGAPSRSRRLGPVADRAR